MTIHSLNPLGQNGEAIHIIIEREKI